MIVENTSLTGTKIIRPNVFDDFRGYFFESFKSTNFAEYGLPTNFVQDNEVKSSRVLIPPGSFREIHSILS